MELTRLGLFQVGLERFDLFRERAHLLLDLVLLVRQFQSFGHRFRMKLHGFFAGAPRLVECLLRRLLRALELFDLLQNVLARSVSPLGLS